MGSNETTPLRSDSLLGKFTKATESRINETISVVTSIIQAPRCGATVFRTHLRLGAECTFLCDGNYICAQILIAYIIILIRS